MAEAYGAGDAGGKMVKDFVKAWVKVMELDRFDVRRGGVEMTERLVI